VAAMAAAAAAWLVLVLLLLVALALEPSHHSCCQAAGHGGCRRPHLLLLQLLLLWMGPRAGCAPLLLLLHCAGCHACTGLTETGVMSQLRVWPCMCYKLLHRLHQVTTCLTYAFSHRQCMVQQLLRPSNTAAPYTQQSVTRQ
jgi:hypothetical protein